MVVKSDQERVKALLSEAITVLCKNGLSYRSEFCVEGLLGITLDQNEVFLVNIKETITNYEEPVPFPEEDPHNGSIQSQTHSFSRESSKRPVPVHVFQSKPSTKPSRSRRKRSVEVESSSNRSIESTNQTLYAVPTDPTQLSLTDDNLFSTAFDHSSVNSDRQDIDSGPPSKRQAKEEEEEEVRPEGSKAENPIIVKAELISDEEDVEEIEHYDEGDSKHELSISHSGDHHHVNPNTSQVEQFMVQGEEMQPGCSSWSTPSAATSYNTSQALVPTSSQSTTAQMENNPFEILDVWSLYQTPQKPKSATDKQTKFKIQCKILTMDGPVINSTVVSRSFRHKADTLVEAMKSMNCTQHSPFYVGEYVKMETRSKIFYKCPPHQILDSALKHYGLSREFYTEMFYKPTKLVEGYKRSANWRHIVLVLMTHSPFGKKEFPLESMALDEEMLDWLKCVQDETRIDASPSDLVTID